MRNVSRFVPGLLLFALCVLGSGAFVWTTPTRAATAPCGLTTAAFCETFDGGPAAVRGRSGDLDSARWSAARLAPSDFSRDGVVNPVALAPVPLCKASFPSLSVYPPDDTLICDPIGATSSQLMTAVAIQNYGNNSYMIRQPFDFANRTGRIAFDVDATAKLLGTYIAIDLTEDPVPAPTFRELENFETGPVPRNGLMMKLLNNCDPNVSPGAVLVYNDYSPTTISPSFQTNGSGCAAVRAGSLNHFEIQLSRTHVEVYGSDYSTDGGRTFPNFHKLYAADLNLPFTRGYVHMAARNHASIKYGFGPDGVYHWDNIGFDGPVISNSRSYEVPDSRTIGVYQTHAIMNLGYVLLDGTTGRPAGIYDPVNRLNGFPFQGVSITGALGARLSMNAFVNAISHAATASWGWTYRFNGGTWRNRFLTATEIQALNTAGSAGNVLLLIDVPVGDLRAGSNVLEMLPVNTPMDYPPAVANIDLILDMSGSVSAPNNLRILP
jgi:hypothetical protein